MNKLPFASLSEDTKLPWGKKDPEIQLEQMALQKMKRVAAAKLNEADLMDNRSLFNNNSSELNLLKDWASDWIQKHVQDWLGSFVFTP